MTHSLVVGCAVGLRSQYFVAIYESNSKGVPKKHEYNHSQPNTLKLFGAELASVVSIQKLKNSDNEQSQGVRACDDNDLFEPLETRVSHLGEGFSLLFHLIIRRGTFLKHPYSSSYFNPFFCVKIFLNLLLS